jgi:hypothetical protein
MADVKNIDPEVRAPGAYVAFEDITLGADYVAVAPLRGIFVGTGGIVIASVDGTNFHTFKGCASGSVLVGAFKKVKSTANGTTALDLVGCI